MRPKGFTLTMMWVVLGVILGGLVGVASGPKALAVSASVSTAAAHLSAPPALLLVSNVTFEKRATGEVFVDVATSRSPSYHIMKLAGPPRLVIDIDGAQSASPHKDYVADTSVLKRVRVGQFQAKDPAVVRIVADLNGNPTFDVHATSGGLRIGLRPLSVQPALPPRLQISPANATAGRQQTPSPAPRPSDKKSVEVASVKMPQVVTTKLSVPPATTKDKVTLPVPATTSKAASPAAPATNAKTSAPVVAMTDRASMAARPTQDKTSSPAGSALMAFPSPVVAAPRRAETHEALKQEVHNTLPNAAPVPQEAPAPLPPATTATPVAAAPAALPASATPEVLRAAQAAQILTPTRNEAAAAAQGAPAASSTPPAGDTKPAYTGELISLNLKDVDLKDFFRLIHEISGLNIIIDPNVSGGVTMVLDSVPWDQALDIVLKNNGLGKTLEGNVLRIARMSTLTAEQDEVTKLEVARMNAAPLVTIFRPVNYAKAQDIVMLLKTWSGGKSGGALSPRGTALFDTRSNTVIVSDVGTQIPMIENAIDKLDKKAKQISIEARVVLANASFVRTLASSLLGGFVNNSTTSTGTSSLSSTATIPSPTASAPIPVTTVTPATAQGFGIAAVTNVGAHYFINAAISAAEERDQAKTISRPSIVTQNNVEGMVQQGVQVPIQTTINNTITVQYYNATLQLRVTPQVTDSSDIFLKIDVQNNSVGASISQIGPEIATQQATTSVLVPDGGTVVFGGITVTTRSKSANYIPLIGSIPILGNLFKNSQVQDQDQELLFFVSPKILAT